MYLLNDLVDETLPDSFTLKPTIDHNHMYVP
jgi:hypothetical protein